jgi:hypothetical protein
MARRAGRPRRHRPSPYRSVVLRFAQRDWIELHELAAELNCTGADLTSSAYDLLFWMAREMQAGSRLLVRRRDGRTVTVRFARLTLLSPPDSDQEPP